jgi:ATP-dependent RNA helicase DOB1
MSTDLFSFLDDNNDDEILQNEEVSMQVDDEASTPQLKRKAGSPPADKPSNGVADDTMQQDRVARDEAPQKKPRIGSPAPIVLDDFETEAKREVAASAGLTGSTVESGSRLELRHQVSPPLYILFVALSQSLGQASSRRAARVQLYPHISTCSPSKA